MRVEGQLMFSNVGMITKAVLAGRGLAYVAESRMKKELDRGTLIPLLEDWCPSFPGYHLYYPSRRQPTPAFTAVVNALRYRAKPQR